MFICPNCGGQLKFDPSKQKMLCAYCDSEFDPEAVEDLHTAEEQPAAAEEEAPQEQKWKESETFETHVYTCPECGGELISDETTVATFCSFCGATALLESHIRREKRPSWIIPFKNTREDCEKLYRKAVSKAIFAPGYMQEPEAVERFRGIYMPYWIYSHKYRDELKVPGTTTSRRGDYVYTKHYSIKSRLDAQYAGVSYDASSSFSDNLSNAIAPFHMKEAVSFDPSYLSGFYGDSSDVPAQVYRDDAMELICSDAANEVIRTGIYHKYVVKGEDIKREIRRGTSEESLGMFPVWFLSVRHKDRVSYAVINGETGKVAVDIPIDFRKYLLGSLILAIPLFLIYNLFLTLKPEWALAISMILALVALFISNSQMNRVFARENKLDDKGWNSVNPVQAEIQAELRKEGAVIKEETVLSDSQKVANTLQTIGWILVVVFASFFGGAGILLAGVIYFVTNKVKPRTKAQINHRKTVVKAPKRNKWGTLWKPLAGIAIAAMVMIALPAEDLYFYIAAAICMVMVAWTFFDIVKEHNRLTTRPLPQFNVRGGDAYEQQ